MKMKEAQTDKERILANVIKGLAASQLLAKGRHYNEEDFQSSTGTYVHLAYDRPARVGDLVLCQTSGFWGSHPWQIAWYVEHEPRGFGTATLREIGTERLCNMGNESFLPVVGMRPLELLEGEQYLFYRKVMRAFSRGGEYVYRFGGLDFPEKRVGRVGIREAFGGHGAPGESVPFSVDIPFNRKTSIKAILAAMREAGYGTRKFVHRAAEGCRA